MISSSTVSLLVVSAISTQSDTVFVQCLTQGKKVGPRPWKVAGEGRLRKGAYDAHDLRFTTKGGALYVFAFGWPEDGKLVVHSLAKPNTVSDVALLGHAGSLQWTQDETGLTVALPAEKPCEHAIALKITGQDLQPVPTAVPSEAIQPGQQVVEVRSHDAKTWKPINLRYVSLKKS